MNTFPTPCDFEAKQRNEIDVSCIYNGLCTPQTGFIVIHVDGAKITWLLRWA
jgi:hypothetical protein